jgi:hypothetical protein
MQRCCWINVLCIFKKTETLILPASAKVIKNAVGLCERLDCYSSSRDITGLWSSAEGLIHFSLSAGASIAFLVEF